MKKYIWLIMSAIVLALLNSWFLIGIFNEQAEWQLGVSVISYMLAIAGIIMLIIHAIASLIVKKYLCNVFWGLAIGLIFNLILWYVIFFFMGILF